MSQSGCQQIRRRRAAAAETEPTVQSGWKEAGLRTVLPGAPVSSRAPKPAELSNGALEESVDQPLHRPRAVLALAAIVGLLVAACGTGGVSPATSSHPPASGSAAGCGTPAVAPSASGSAAAGSPQKLIVGLGYIPSVQFAQFYLAQQAGYYRDAGLDVTFQNGRDSDLVPLAGQGALDIALADGTSVIPAVGQGIPVKYIASIYEK